MKASTERRLLSFGISQSQTPTTSRIAPGFTSQNVSKRKWFCCSLKGWPASFFDFLTTSFAALRPIDLTSKSVSNNCACGRGRGRAKWMERTKSRTFRRKFGFCQCGHLAAFLFRAARSCQKQQLNYWLRFFFCLAPWLLSKESRMHLACFNNLHGQK